MSTILALLSIFKINFLGSLISADLWILKLLGKYKFPKWFIFILLFLLIQVVLSIFTRETSDLLFNLRIVLIILLAFSLSISTFSTQIIGIGLLVLNYLLISSDLTYYSGVKSAIAITPLLLLPEYAKNKYHILILIIIPAIALYFSSRALLLGFLIYILSIIFIRRRRLLLPVSLGVVAVFATNFNALITDQWYSNLVRLNMILEGVKPGSIQTVFLGQGYSSWRAEISTAFQELGLKQSGIDTLNPHFIFAEMIIEWGWVGFLIFMFLLSRSFRISRAVPSGIAILMACIFTTNTGLERLFLSMGLGILWQSKE